MSLKAFHIFFVAASILLAFGFAVWCFAQFSDTHLKRHLIYGVGSGLAGIGLIFYGKYVLKKLKDISYL